MDEPPNPPSESQDDLDPLLRRLAAADPVSGRRVVDSAEPIDATTEEQLMAYRSGALSDAARGQLEQRLRDDPALRRRLAALAGVAPELPESIRERVLDNVAPRRRWQPVAALAATVLALVGLSIVVPPIFDDEAPLSPYTVELRGMSDLRSGPGTGVPVPGAAGSEGTSSVDVLPETRVRMVVRPETSAEPAVDFGLYRSQGHPAADGFERVDPRLLGLDRHAGAATLTATAGDLVGAEPGIQLIYLVIARPGELPARLGRQPTAEPGRQIVPLHLRMLASPSPAQRTQ